MIKPRVPTILKPLPVAEPPEASNEGDAAAVDAAIEEELACNICNGIDSEPSNQIILCDQCDGAFHMLCLPRPLPQVPEGEWKCHICVKIFGKKDEPSMELAVGTRLWVQDKKGLWGKAKILKSEFSSAVADEAAAETSTSSPSSSTAPMSHDAAPPDAAPLQSRQWVRRCESPNLVSTTAWLASSSRSNRARTSASSSIPPIARRTPPPPSRS